MYNADVIIPCCRATNSLTGVCAAISILNQSKLRVSQYSHQTKSGNTIFFVDLYVENMEKDREMCRACTRYLNDRRN